MKPRKWLHLELRAPSPALEALVEALLERGALGAWQESGKAHLYFPDEFKPIEVHATLRRLAPLFGLEEREFEYVFSWQEEEDWQAEWKRTFRPVFIGDRFVVRAPWHQLPPEQTAGRIVLEIEPGLAFGTGTHPSTQLTLRALEKLIRPQARVLDVGTGSGILAIAAAKLGAAEVVAFDVDPLAADNARNNLRRNGVAGKVHLFVGTIDALSPARNWDLVLANIQRQVLLRLLPDLAARLAGGGHVVLAGLIATEQQEITSEIAKLGLAVVEVLGLDEWIAVVARKP